MVFMETHSAIFKLSVSLRSEVCHRDPETSKKPTIFYERQEKLQWLYRLKNDSPWRKQLSESLLGFRPYSYCLLYYFQDIFPSVILFDPLDGNPRKWVLYDHPYLQMKNKTKQNRYSESWLCWDTSKARLRSPGFLACIFFYSLLSAFNNLWFSLGLGRIFLLVTNSLFCFPAHYLFLCMSALSWNGQISSRAFVEGQLSTPIFSDLILMAIHWQTTVLPRVQANYKEDSLVWRKEHLSRSQEV